VSWDLVVYAARRGDPWAAAEASGSAADEQADGFSVSRQIRGRWELSFTGDGPLAVEREDLPDAVVVAGVGLRVMYELSVPSILAEVVRTEASQFARRLADTCDGVVYDPQEDRVVWPRSAVRRLPPAPVDRLTVLDLSWYLVDETAEAALALWFDMIRRWWPEALPRRFGTFEPMQHRCDEEGVAGLVQLARRETGLVFWSASRPFFGGSLDLERRHPEPAGHFQRIQPGREVARRRVATVSVHVDARLLDRHAWRDDLIVGFLAAADRAGCIYAHAHAERNWGLSGNRLWSDGRTDLSLAEVVDRDGRWAGLPSAEVWLGWLGRPYRALEVGEPAGGGRIVIAGGPPTHPDAPPMAPLPVSEQWKAKYGRPAVRVPEGL
jgi:hypothetical protein